MQEEVENRTVNLAISTGKLTGRVLFRGMMMYLQHRRNKNLQKAAARDAPVHGKQSVEELIGQGQGWHTAIGLQAVDGLKPSKYLVETAIQNIEGEISLDEAQQLLDTYYEENPKSEQDERTEEADKVSVRIAKILSEKAFSFTPNEYISIHKKLFTGIYGHAGRIRDYNITKKEWVLDGETVLYGSASELRETLDYDFSQEKNFTYKGLAMDEIIHHLAKFVSGLCQIHIFSEGNTRTTAVFFITEILRQYFINHPQSIDKYTFLQNSAFTHWVKEKCSKMC